MLQVYENPRTRDRNDHRSPHLAPFPPPMAFARGRSCARRRMRRHRGRARQCHGASARQRHGKTSRIGALGASGHRTPTHDACGGRARQRPRHDPHQTPIRWLGDRLVHSRCHSRRTDAHVRARLHCLRRLLPRCQRDPRRSGPRPIPQGGPKRTDDLQAHRAPRGRAHFVTLCQTRSVSIASCRQSMHDLSDSSRQLPQIRHGK